MKAICAVLFAGMVGCAFVQPVSTADAATFTEKVLYSFCSQRNCKDGAYPEAKVIEVNGILYKTTSGGGRGVACYTQGCGTVFSLDPNMGVETVLHSFCRQLNCPDGADPFDAGLIDVKGTMYGTAFEGGGNGCGGSGCGTVFSVDPNTGAETVLYSFNDSPSDGAYPQGELLHVEGTIYGTTQGGGAGGMGTVFALDRKKATETLLYSFCSRQNCADGFNPVGLIDVNGTLYGTTLQGGSYNCDQGEGCGTAFSLDPNTGAETVLHSFGNGTDGGHPYAGLIALNGILFGTTGYGGADGGGTVFSIDPNTGAETVLYSFCSQQNCTDGANPSATLIDVKGTLYGTTRAGGSVGNGTVFLLDPGTGAETVLYSFSSGTDGADPQASLINVNGTLYGTTGGGGAYGEGTVFVLKKKRQARLPWLAPSP
ncbi:MAG TPA: choice-of-anchor tandem repeat GloVer-containing protein [Rhizomicrobium sp.]